jgi:hypothetical protein
MKSKTIYSSMKLELLALKWAVANKFQSYLKLEGDCNDRQQVPNPLGYIQAWGG